MADVSMVAGAIVMLGSTVLMLDTARKLVWPMLRCDNDESSGPTPESNLRGRLGNEKASKGSASFISPKTPKRKV